MAKRQRSSPFFAAVMISRESDDIPVMPNKPLCLLKRIDADLVPIFSLSIMYETAPMSISPERVPIINPSSGVNPIDVSTDSPYLIAQTDAPLPRWQVITLTVLGSTPKIYRLCSIHTCDSFRGNHTCVFRIFCKVHMELH